GSSGGSHRSSGCAGGATREGASSGHGDGAADPARTSLRLLVRDPRVRDLLPRRHDAPVQDDRRRAPARRGGGDGAGRMSVPAPLLSSSSMSERTTEPASGDPVPWKRNVRAILVFAAISEMLELM